MSYISPEQFLEDRGVVSLPIPIGLAGIAARDQVGPPANRLINKKTQSEPFRFNRTSLQDIMGMDFPPTKWAIEGYVPEGFSVLAGRQKLGKTWLALDMSIAVAMGDCALGSIMCEQGNVLYMDLENGHRRIKGRIEIMLPNDQARSGLDNIDIVTESPTLDKGVIGALEDWRQSVPNPRFVVIDVLQRIKPAGNGARNAYENDYAIFQDLQSWATTNGVAVLGLHHTRKGGADDPLEALSGSNGLSACADTTLVLDRNQNGMTLYVRGRDVEEKETALRHDLGNWTILGEAAEIHKSDERTSILSALRTADATMTPAELVAATRMKRNNLDQLLHQMGEKGEIQKIKRGYYIHPDRTDLIPTDPNKIDKIDKKYE